MALSTQAKRGLQVGLGSLAASSEVVTAIESEGGSLSTATKHSIRTMFAEEPAASRFTAAVTNGTAFGSNGDQYRLASALGSDFLAQQIVDEMASE